MRRIDDKAMFRMLWRLALAAPLPLVLGSSACGGKVAGKGAFCADDRPPGMKGYPGCGAPFCVPLDTSLLDGGTLDTADASAMASQCQALCGDAGPFVRSCSTFAAKGGEWVKCQPDCTGRRPVALVDPPTTRLDELGGYFAEMARLEAASVAAFRQLARELVAHGAPRALVVATRRAARDEIRHARLARALAERFGAGYVAPEVMPAPLRSLVEIAMDNAIEGCVRESWGALAAMYQARHAADAGVRRAMRSIAHDETRHASLAYAIASWADMKLGAPDRARVASARRAAVASLRASLVRQPPPGLASLAGVASSATAAHLAERLDLALWA